MKEYEPQKQKDHESVQVKIPLLFTFLCIIMIVCSLQPMPQIHDSQNV